MPSFQLSEPREPCIARVLGDSGAVIEAARRIRVDAISTTERRARHWANVARAFHQ